MKSDSDSLIKPFIAPSKPVQITNEAVIEYSLGHVLPDYLSVDLKDSVRQWKIEHETKMFDQLITNQKDLRDTQYSFKRDISNMLRKVPIDLITKEFLIKEKLTINGRAYIIDKLIPVVVLGLEQLLMEAERRDLIGHGEEREPNFNPINYLAQYLMRNNPLFSNYNEASPYVRGLRKVVEELKTEIFQLSDDKLAKVKASAMTKRNEREREEARKKREAKRRIEIYQKLFDQFLVRNQTKVDYETVHLSIKSFSEIVAKFPPEMKTKLAPILTMKYSEEKDKLLSRKDFGLLISHYADEMPLDIFDQFAEHLSKCAQLYRSQMEKDTRKKLLSELFMTCDLDEMGLLDRQRILMLFDQFYTNTPNNIKIMLRDPRHWPICDYKKDAESIKKDANLNNENQNFIENMENKNVNAVEIERLNDDSEYIEIIDNINEKEEQIEKDVLGMEINKKEIEKGKEEIEEELEDNEKESKDVEKEKEDEMNEKNETKEEKYIEVFDEIKEEVLEKEKERKEEGILNEEIQINKETVEELQVKEMEFKEEEKEEEEINEKEEIKEDKKIEVAAEMKEIIDVKSPKLLSIDNLEIKTTEDSSDNLKEEFSIEESTTAAVKLSTEEDDIESEEESSTTSDKENKEVQQEDVAEDVLETLNDLVDIETLSISEGEDITLDKTGHNLNREMTKLSTVTSLSVPYDDENITFTQFFQVTEEFLGDIPSIEILDELIEFIREGYQETPEERLKRLKKAHRAVQSSRRRNAIHDLFNVWDRDNAGFVSMQEISETFVKYRNGLLIEGVKAAKKEARIKLTRLTKDVKLNRKEFRTFVYTVARVSGMLDEENEVETMVHYFIGLIQKTYEEKLRGEARSKWLKSILWAAEVSCGSIEGVYRSVFQALYKDAESHGAGKIISSSLALLENNDMEVQKRGIYSLHFVAATNDQSDYVVGKRVDRSIKNISFQAIYTGNIVSLIHACSSPLVQYWNPNITESAKEGSLVVVPIKDDLERVFGVLSVDTLNDPNPEKATFFSFEISFFQGVGKQFSTAFQHVEMLRRLVKISESAMVWICRQSESIKGANFYLREKRDQKNVDEFVLRLVLCSNDLGEITRCQKPPRMDKADNLFKTYLFDAIETSQSITADAYGDRNMAIPLRDLQGMAFGVMELNIGTVKCLPSAENMEVGKLMNLLQLSSNDIIKISQLADVKIDVPQDNEVNETLLVSATGKSNVEVIFDQYMLSELRASVAKLDSQSYAEIKSYKDPPVTIHAIMQATLALLYPKEGHLGLFENWEKCKKYISLSLSKLILAFDPFGDVSMISMEVVEEAMKKIPRSEIDKHGSKPTLDLYNWVFCCVTLIVHRLNNQ